MDPTTTLFTFMLQTEPSVQAVDLVGSWDNFTKTYSMQRDIRRDRGQWRGCYSFKDIICDGDGGTSPRRDGGLKMGQTYYFYYELDGSTETYDPSLPSTNACPYLPGQTVNTLWVPVEQILRKRSASLSSMRQGDWKTMNPDDRFATPRPAPSPPTTPGFRRIGSAPLMVRHTRSARSLSPNPGWSFSPRKLFSRKTSSSSLRDSCSPREVPSTTPGDDRQSVRSSEGSRSRDISPESLRRFLSEDTLPTSEPFEANDRPSLIIPEDIAEENEDDENFATPITQEIVPFTVLSPPPTQHSHASTTSLVPTSPSKKRLATPNHESAAPAPPSRTPPRIPLPAKVAIPVLERQQPSLADISFLMPTSPISPASNDNDYSSFYFSEDDDDDDDELGSSSSNDEEWLPDPDPGEPATTTTMTTSHLGGGHSRDLSASLSTYSLPRSLGDMGAKLSSTTAEERPPTRDGYEGVVPVGNTALLTSPIPNAGLHDLVSELGWIADGYGGRD